MKHFHLWHVVAVKGIAGNISVPMTGAGHQKSAVQQRTAGGILAVHELRIGSCGWNTFRVLYIYNYIYIYACITLILL